MSCKKVSLWSSQLQKEINAGLGVKEIKFENNVGPLYNFENNAFFFFFLKNYSSLNKERNNRKKGLLVNVDYAYRGGIHKFYSIFSFTLYFII